MKTIEKAYLIGLGAIGGIYSSRIYDHDRNKISIIGDRERIRRYGSRGVLINEKIYDFDYAEAGTGKRDADLILITVKNNALREAIEAMKSFVGEDTIILSLLNGIDSEDLISTSLQRGKILHSYCVGTDAVRTGQKIQFENCGRIVFGSMNEERYQMEVDLVKAFLDQHSIPCVVSKDIRRDQWWKFMMNVGINQVSAVLQAEYGVFQQQKYARELMTEASREVVRLANRLDIALCEQDLLDSLAVIDTLTPQSRTSMCQDMEAGRKTEVELFGDKVCALGEQLGVETPVNRTLSQLIHIQEERNKNRRNLE